MKSEELLITWKGDDRKKEKNSKYDAFDDEDMRVIVMVMKTSKKRKKRNRVGNKIAGKKLLDTK